MPRIHFYYSSVLFCDEFADREAHADTTYRSDLAHSLVAKKLVRMFYVFSLHSLPVISHREDQLIKLLIFLEDGVLQVVPSHNLNRLEMSL